MVIDLQVALDLYPQRHSSVMRNLLQHVVEEIKAGGNFGNAALIQIQF